MGAGRAGRALDFVLRGVARSGGVRAGRPHTQGALWSLALAALFLLVPVPLRAVTEIEVACFQGGYGIDFFEQAAREYEKMHPGVKITITGHPRIWEKLLPRFAANTVPDLCWPGWGMNTWELVFGQKLRPLDSWLDQPAEGGGKTWRETFVPSLLKRGQFKGATYLLPYNFDVFGIWYNRKMFARHGWTPPRTYEELLELSEKIRAERIAPITFTGRYPSYLLRGCYYPWLISAGGLEAFNAIQNLEPDAWKHPAALRAARAIVEMKKLGNFQPGAIGMSHTESQLEFLVERAAMVPCGTWLHAEMKNIMPPDFEMEFMPCPVFRDGVGDPSLLCAQIDGKGWCIPTATNNAEVAAGFFRYLSSPPMAKRFVETKGTLMAIQDLGEVNAPPHLRTVLKLVAESKGTWTNFIEEWYPALARKQDDLLRDLINGMVTPEEFVELMEAASREVREDPQVTKFRVD